MKKRRVFLYVCVVCWLPLILALSSCALNGDSVIKDEAMTTNNNTTVVADSDKGFSPGQSILKVNKDVLKYEVNHMSNKDSGWAIKANVNPSCQIRTTGSYYGSSPLPGEYEWHPYWAAADYLRYAVVPILNPSQYCIPDKYRDCLPYRFDWSGPDDKHIPEEVREWIASSDHPEAEKWKFLLEDKVVAPITRKEGGAIVVTGFDTNKANLTEEIKKKLSAVPDQISRVTKIIGFGDVRGSIAYNKTLANARAEAVKKFLASRHDLDTSDVTIVAGAQDASGNEYDDNRRVEIYGIK